ncbi:MAG: hypothetical protein M1812_007449 [Candelaria pacifica]|nr:MAG: hypothetical protein M1812_007449 [Candelaria pacifica]
MVVAQPSRTVTQNHRAEQKYQPKQPELASKPSSVEDKARSSSSRSSQASAKSETSTLGKLHRQVNFSSCAKATVAIGTLTVALITLAVYNHRSDRLATWTAYKDWREDCRDDKTNSKDCQLALSKPLPQPPYLPVEYYTGIVKRTISQIRQNASLTKFGGLDISSEPASTNSTKCITIETSSARVCLAVKAVAVLATISLVGFCLVGLYWFSRPSTTVQEGLPKSPLLIVPPRRKMRSYDCSARSGPLVGVHSNSVTETNPGLRHRGQKRERGVDLNVTNNGTASQNAEYRTHSFRHEFDMLGICRVLHDFSPQPTIENEKLTVRKGELVTGLKRMATQRDSFEWWHCETHDGRLGFLPRFILESNLDYSDTESDAEDELEALSGDSAYDSGVETQDPSFTPVISSADKLKASPDFPSSIEHNITKDPNTWTQIVPSAHVELAKSPTWSGIAQYQKPNRFTQWLSEKIPPPHTKVKSGSVIQGIAQTGAVAAATAGGKAGQEKAIELPNKCLDASMAQHPQDS